MPSPYGDSADVFLRCRVLRECHIKSGKDSGKERGGYYVIGLYFSGRVLLLVDGSTDRSLFVGWALEVRGG